MSADLLSLEVQSSFIELRTLSCVGEEFSVVVCFNDVFAQRCPLWWRTELLLNSLLLLICLLIICNFLSVRSKLLTNAVAFAACGVNGAKRMCVWCCAQIAVSQKALQHLDSASWRVAELFRPSQTSLKCSEHPDKKSAFSVRL